jgi:hypothetical protein
VDLRYGELDDALMEQLMIRVLQLDQDVVRSGWKPVHDDRFAARVGPAPRSVIDGHMDVFDPRKYGNSGRPKHRHAMQILRAILNDYPTVR